MEAIPFKQNLTNEASCSSKIGLQYQNGFTSTILSIHRVEKFELIFT